MRDVYSKATKALIWLEETSADVGSRLSETDWNSNFWLELETELSAKAKPDLFSR